MNKKDIEIKNKIESFFKKDMIGQSLKDYFDNLPEKNIWRTLFIFSLIYPEKENILEDEFLFILHMFSNKRYITQKNFSYFISFINIRELTKDQKNRLADVVKTNIELLCENSHFELDSLLVRLFKPNELIQYIKDILDKSSSITVYQHIFNIYKYEKEFFKDTLQEVEIEILEQEALQKSKNIKMIHNKN